MKGFPGFPDGKLKLTQIPNLFFSDLLPIIDDLGELKVTLYAFWALQYREGKVRYLRLTDFLNDSELMKGLGPTATIAANNLVDALDRAVARGTFLHISVGSADGNMDLYFLNTEKGRSAIEGITRGEWRPSADDSEPITLLVELREAEQTYPLSWVEEAIQIAVQNNVRKWRYVLSILEKWRQEGKQDGISRRDSQKELRQQIPDDLKDIIKR